MSHTEEEVIAPAQAAETTSEKTDRKAERKAKKAAKKEAKKQRRDKRRAAYKALSRGKRFFRWFFGILAGLVALALLAALGVLLVRACMDIYVENRYAESLAAQAPREEILLHAPEDTEGAARVAATEAYDPDDTWAVYLYICGSDLESAGQNQLSDTTEYYVDMERSAYLAQKDETTKQRFHTFVTEMQQEGMHLPDYLFLPTEHVSYDEDSSSEETSVRDGYATLNLQDLLSVDLPENVSMVIETGGAYNWSLTQINPNASQRFLYDHDGFTELGSTYPKNMGSVQTFTDFLDFCQTEHPADHQMLLIWNHGSGPFGFCNDEIYGGDCITLSEMQEAFATVYGSEPAEPPFELVGYDACLMASTEVAEALHGYTRYLAASEETEAGDGWAYDKWVAELAAHPEMNGAQLGKVIADTFVESCANFSINMEWLGFESVATFSVVDVEKSHAVYEAYTDLCAAALSDTAEAPWPLAAFGRAAAKSIRYAGSYYKYFNTVDLGSFMQNLSSDYPAETKAVSDALHDAVLYHRETSYTQGSEGLSIYFPATVDSFYGLLYYLDYLDTICADPDIEALYYYKIAGCLSEELKAYAADAGYGTFATLDTTPLDRIAAMQPGICEDNTLELPIDNEVAALMQDMSLAVAQLDADAGDLCFFGDDAYVYLDGYRTLRTTFCGRWATLDGHVLPLEIIDHTDAFIRYRVPIRYQGNEDSYLVIAYDHASGKYSILGVQAINEEADTLGRNLAPVEIGSRIAIRYRMESLDDERIQTEYGTSFIFTADSKVEKTALQNGEYYLAITITDTRGDSYYPALVFFRMAGGEIADMSVSEDLGAVMSID